MRWGLAISVVCLCSLACGGDDAPSDATTTEQTSTDPDPTTGAPSTVADGSGGGVPVCGNGVLEAGEQCDGLDFGGQDCITVGFDGGALACNADATTRPPASWPSPCSAPRAHATCRPIASEACRLLDVHAAARSGTAWVR